MKNNEIKEEVLKEITAPKEVMNSILEIRLKQAIDLTIKEIQAEILQKIEDFENPYPKDVFEWNNKEELDFNRGRFNKHCFEIVENTRKDILKDLIGDEDEEI